MLVFGSHNLVQRVRSGMHLFDTNKLHSLSSTTHSCIFRSNPNKLRPSSGPTSRQSLSVSRGRRSRLGLPPRHLQPQATRAAHGTEACRHQFSNDQHQQSTPINHHHQSISTTIHHHQSASPLTISPPSVNQLTTHVKAPVEPAASTFVVMRSLVEMPGPCTHH